MQKENQPNVIQAEPDLNEIMKIRRDKLAAVSYTHLTLPTNSGV